MQSGYQPECERFNILIHLWPFLLIVAGEHSKISVLYIEFCVFCFSLCKKNVELSVHNIQICCWLVMLFVSHSFDWINLIISCAYASGRNKKKTEEEMMYVFVCGASWREMTKHAIFYLFIYWNWISCCVYVHWPDSSCLLISWLDDNVHSFYLYLFLCLFHFIYTKRENDNKIKENIDRKKYKEVECNKRNLYFSVIYLEIQFFLNFITL